MLPLHRQHLYRRPLYRRPLCLRSLYRRPLCLRPIYRRPLCLRSLYRRPLCLRSLYMRPLYKRIRCHLDRCARPSCIRSQKRSHRGRDGRTRESRRYCPDHRIGSLWRTRLGHSQLQARRGRGKKSLLKRDQYRAGPLPVEDEAQNPCHVRPPTTSVTARCVEKTTATHPRRTGSSVMNARHGGTKMHRLRFRWTFPV